MDNQLIATMWQNTCQSARSSGQLAASRCDGKYAELILERTAEYCEQPTPITDAELSNRTQQAIRLTGIRHSISNAALAASRHPRVADSIWNATRKFSSGAALDSYTARESMILTQELMVICSSDR